MKSTIFAISLALAATSSAQPLLNARQHRGERHRPDWDAKARDVTDAGPQADAFAIANGLEEGAPIRRDMNDSSYGYQPSSAATSAIQPTPNYYDQAPPAAASASSTYYFDSAMETPNAEAAWSKPTSVPSSSAPAAASDSEHYQQHHHGHHKSGSSGGGYMVYWNYMLNGQMYNKSAQSDAQGHFEIAVAAAETIESVRVVYGSKHATCVLQDAQAAQVEVVGEQSGNTYLQLEEASAIQIRTITCSASN